MRIENIESLENLRIVIQFPNNRVLYFRVTKNDYVKRDKENDCGYLSTVIPITSTKWDSSGTIQISLYELG